MRYAFMKDLGDGRWSVAIVGNVVNGTGELLDFNVLPSKEDADAWRIKKIGNGQSVYTAPTNH